MGDAERTMMRIAQARRVMPVIGALYDAWSLSAHDFQDAVRNDCEALADALDDIVSAVEQHESQRATMDQSAQQMDDARNYNKVANRIARALCELEHDGRCELPECHCSSSFMAEYLRSADAVLAAAPLREFERLIMDRCARAMCCGCKEDVERDGAYHVHRYENGNVHKQQCGALPILNLAMEAHERDAVAVAAT